MSIAIENPTIARRLDADVNAEADRVSVQFLDTIQTNYKRTGTIREKYNVVTGSDEAPVLAGYHENLIGFGWTNGVYLKMKEVMDNRARQAAD